ncbi:MAG: hypothetical protein GXP28_01690 [Planctomycetes bacterium]|nr:hypothetical protein [Planctomycetota bacterium]
MLRLTYLLALVVGALSVAALTGCGQSSAGIDPEQLAKHRARLTLSEEPDAAQVVPEVRDALLGSDDHKEDDHGHEIPQATEPREVVLVGQIGGLSNPWKETQPDFPFARNQAAFFLADPMAVVENEESGHAHAPGEECAFCAAHAADRSAMLAMVRFLDENGKVLQTDVRQLFDVKENDTVVIQGTARVIEGGMMVVDATGLYIRE